MAVLVAVRDLMFRSKILAAAERIGAEVRLAPRGMALAQALRELGPATLLVDLGEAGVVEQLPEARRSSAARILGFLGHLQEDLRRAALASGADEVLTRGQLVGRLDDILRDGAAPARIPSAGAGSK
jgi:DNA-binding response OmpR family regulator